MIDKRITIGIDPGQTGAIAAIDTTTGDVVALHDMPTCARLHGKGQQVDASHLASIMLDTKAGTRAEVVLEAVAAMPGQGVSSTFRFGEAVESFWGSAGRCSSRSNG